MTYRLLICVMMLCEFMQCCVKYVTGTSETSKARNWSNLADGFRGAKTQSCILPYPTTATCILGDPYYLYHLITRCLSLQFPDLVCWTICTTLLSTLHVEETVENPLSGMQLCFAATISKDQMVQTKCLWSSKASTHGLHTKLQHQLIVAGKRI